MPQIDRVPSIVYFHENQFAYPRAPKARVDHGFAYTNLLTAFAADRCLFNSQFNLVTLIEDGRDLVGRMPDSAKDHDFVGLRSKSEVLAPGFSPPPATVQLNLDRKRRVSDPLVIGWVSRWEHDKRPDEFLTLLRKIKLAKVKFRLVLLGPRPNTTPDALLAIRQEFGSMILHDGYSDSRQEYWIQLRRIDAVVSTAAHEFFGIAICEAIWAGAIPVLPNRVAYPELVDEGFLYGSLDDAADRLKSIGRAGDLSAQRKHCRQSIKQLQATVIAKKLDEVIEDCVCDS